MQARLPGAPRLLPILAMTVLLSAVLAGCNGNGTPTSTSATSTTATTSAVQFDGEAALEFVKGLALQADGSPRFRMPGTEGQREGAAYLWSQMEVPGWTREWQNLTWEDYLTLDRGVIAGYGPGTRHCTQAMQDNLTGVPFHNLFAVRASGVADARLFLVGAHWDSQRRSDFDPDPAKQNLPDPGANDGASGVGLLLQWMHELEGIELPFDVGVVFLDGEDGFFDCYPLAGSLYFAQHPPIEVDRFLLLDMVGDAGARYIREGASVRSDPKLVDLLWRHGHAQGGAENFIERTTTISDDHLAFIQSGVPSVDLIDAGRSKGFGFPPQWDTSFDTVDKLSPDMLSLVGRTIEASVADPLFIAEWPALAAQNG